jgi:hypothetical protein
VTHAKKDPRMRIASGAFIDRGSCPRPSRAITMTAALMFPPVDCQASLRVRKNTSSRPSACAAGAATRAECEERGCDPSHRQGSAIGFLTFRGGPIRITDAAKMPRAALHVSNRQTFTLRLCDRGRRFGRMRSCQPPHREGGRKGPAYRGRGPAARVPLEHQADDAKLGRGGNFSRASRLSSRHSAVEKGRAEG